MSASFKERLLSHYSEKYGDEIVIDHGLMLIRKYIEAFKDDFDDVIYVSDEIEVNENNRSIKINNVTLSFQASQNKLLVFKTYSESGRTECIDVLVPSNGKLVSEELLEGSSFSEEMFDKYLEVSFRAQMNLS